ncbi:zinc finger protein 585a [Colletotrichum asianum]
MSDLTELAAIRAKLKERERTSDYFNQIWEDEALPRMKETMDEGNITDYNISIQADYGEYGVLRIVEVVTRKRLPEFTNQELIKNVSKIFTPERSLHVTISFTIGVVKRTSGPEEP